MKKLLLLVIVIMLAGIFLPKNTVVGIINIIKLNLSFINLLPNEKASDKEDKKLNLQPSSRNQVYKWKDEKGQIHFSNTPPKEK